MAINYYQLQCFVEVYRAGSFREAGKNLYMSYQGISQNIAKLEKHLGRPLFFQIRLTSIESTTPNLS